MQVAGPQKALQQHVKIEKQLATLVQWVSRKRGEKKKVRFWNKKGFHSIFTSKNSKIKIK